MKNIWRDYAGVTLGVLIAAVGMNIFLIPHKVAAGGVGGLATVLYYLAGWPVGLTMLAINIPLFLLGLKILGRRYGLSTLYGAAALSIAIDLTAPHTPVLTNDLLLNSLYGGVVVGIGMGLVFRFKGNTAGTAMAAAIINKVFGISVGQALLLSDFFVIVFAGVAFQSPELALYALISIFATAQIVDLVQEGPITAKAFLIMTSRADEVVNSVLHELDRGVTFLQGRGGYTGETREMLLCVIATSEVTRLKELIYRLDSQAFVIVVDAHEVLGEGFTEIKGKNP